MNNVLLGTPDQLSMGDGYDYDNGGLELPVPDNIIQTASGPFSLDRERKKKSMGSLSAGGCTGSCR